MSFANSLKKIALEFNGGLRIFKRNVGLNSVGKKAALDALKPNNISLLEPLPFRSRNIEKCCITFPQADSTIKKTIIEPVKNIKINFELPIRSSVDRILELPYYIEKEIKEPPNGNVITKRATHMTIIRRRKMKKHRRKKYYKKHKAFINHRKLLIKQKKEAMFQSKLKDILGEVETYSPEEHVNKTLETVHWEKPLTRVRGFLAPKWVVNQFLEEKKEKKIIGERIKECLKN